MGITTNADGERRSRVFKENPTCKHSWAVRGKMLRTEQVNYCTNCGAVQVMSDADVEKPTDKAAFLERAHRAKIPVQEVEEG